MMSINRRHNIELEVDAFFFFFFDENPELIAQVLSQNELRKIQESSEYWFQKAQDIFQEFEASHASSEDLNTLIELTFRKDFGFKLILEELSRGTLHDFWLLTGRLIAHIDSKAAMKHELNEYPDKRTLAQLFVRQNIMMRGLFAYKRDGEQADIPQITHNVIRYLKNPREEISCFAPEHRELISQELNRGEGFECVLPYMREHGVACTNKLNDGYVCSRILYTDPTLSKWKPEKEQRQTHYWLYAPGEGAKYWDEFYGLGIMALGWDGLGDYASFKTKREAKAAVNARAADGKNHTNDTAAIWSFYKKMKPGDIVYVKQGISSMIGRGEIVGDYEYCPERETYQHVRRVDWTNKQTLPYPERLKSYLSALGNITNLTEVTKQLEERFEISEPAVAPSSNYASYDKSDFLDDVYMSEEKYDTLAGLLLRKKNLILQGAPGVGKTFAAKRLAYSVMGEIDDSRMRTVQFHQSYSYEDFIMGYRPDAGGFKLSFGPFYAFCKEAEQDEDRPWFFIIDEINRGNLGKIFGELLMLIEHDKRGEGHAIRLLYADEQFSVPGNVHIIGMMNTADRSLAMMDYALRRRFAFFDMEPAFGSEGFRRQQSAKQDAQFDALIRTVTTLNRDIETDPSLGKGFRIGHSYFCTSGVVDAAWLSGVVECELIPLLEEYWFDEPSKVETWASRLRSAGHGQ